MPAATYGGRPAGKDISHTARTHVSEESDSGEWGGEAADQGEHSPIQHVPDTKREARIPKVG